MNGNSENQNLEDRLAAIGSALRAHPPLNGRIMEQVRQIACDVTVASSRAVNHPPVRRSEIGLRGRIVTGGVLVVLVVAVIVVLALAPASKVGWAQVGKKLQEQKWIRGRWTIEGKTSTMWMSPSQNVWAFDLDGSDFYFYDGGEKSKYEYHARRASITKLPLGEDCIEDVLPLAALSKNENIVGSRVFQTEKIIEQERREVIEGGKTWLELHMVLSRGEMNHCILRVDPDTKLPVYFLSTSPTDRTESSRWDFDFPKEGPANIFDLGVPIGIQITDLTPKKEALQVLDEIAASRALIGDFRLVVGNSNGQTGYIVYRKGNRWRLDHWRQTRPGAGPPTEAAEGEDLGERLERQLQTATIESGMICDGNAVWRLVNSRSGQESHWESTPHAAPHDLMSGENSGLGFLNLVALLFPNLSPKVGWIFEFDPQRADAPGCVLIKTGAQSTRPNTNGHDWYYLDPAKGYVVVRTEDFSLPIGTPSNPDSAIERSTVRMNRFRKSPQGFWYPEIITSLRSVGRRDQKQNTPVETITLTRYYKFDFEADLPDSLFKVNDSE